MKTMFLTRPKTCCCCVPIFIGILTLCIIQIIMAVFGIWQVFSILRDTNFKRVKSEEVWWIIFYLLCIGPIILGGYYYLRWLWFKSQTSRAMLPRAHFLNIVSVIAQFILISLFGIIIHDGWPAMWGGFDAGSKAGAWVYNIAIVAVLILLNWYWMGICARYAFF